MIFGKLRGHLLIAIVLLITACQPSPNHRTFSKDGIRLRALLKEGIAIYRILEIPLVGLEKSLASEYEIQLPNSKVIAISDLSVDELEELSDNITDHAKLYPSRNDDTKIIQVGGYSFYLRNGQLSQMSASTVTLESTIRLKELVGGWKGNVPRIGRIGQNKLYEMPFTQEEAIELFGEPDTVRDMWHM